MMGVGSIVIGCGCFSGVSSVTGFSAAGVSLGCVASKFLIKSEISGYFTSCTSVFSCCAAGAGASSCVTTGAGASSCATTGAGTSSCTTTGAGTSSCTTGAGVGSWESFLAASFCCIRSSTAESPSAGCDSTTGADCDSATGAG